MSSSYASLSSHAQPWGLPTAPRRERLSCEQKRRLTEGHDSATKRCGCRAPPSLNRWGEEGTNFSSAFTSAPSQNLGFNLAFIQEQEIMMWGQGL